MSRKTAGKTVGRPFAKGPDPRRGVGRKGQSGRKPLAFRLECQRLGYRGLRKMGDYLEQHGPEDPAWRWCSEQVAKYGYAALAPSGAQLLLDVQDHRAEAEDAHAQLIAKLDEMAANLEQHPEAIPSPKPVEQVSSTAPSNDSYRPHPDNPSTRRAEIAVSRDGVPFITQRPEQDREPRTPPSMGGYRLFPRR